MQRCVFVFRAPEKKLIQTEPFLDIWSPLIMMLKPVANPSINSHLSGAAVFNEKGADVAPV